MVKYDIPDAYEDELELYMSAKDVMYLLGIGRNTLYKLLGSGKLPAFRVGSQWRIPRKAFFEFCGDAQ